MNTEQVVEMIDAITEGKYYAHAFPTVEGSNSFSIEVGRDEGLGDEGDQPPSEFWFSSFDAKFLAKIDDPQTAREIAGALVAWANRKEGTSVADQIAWVQKISALQGDGRIRRKDDNLYRVGIDPSSPEGVHFTQAGEAIPGEITERQRNVYHRAPNSQRNRGHLPGGSKPSESRADRYARNIGIMSQAAKDRNLQDLTNIQAELHPHDESHADIKLAITILLEHGAVNPKKGKPSV